MEIPESNFKSIDQDDVIEQIDAERLEDGKWALKKSNVKILILANCKSLTTLVNHSAFLRNSDIFVITVRLNGTFDENEFEQLSDKIVKPIILQIVDADSSRLFFTNTDKKLEEVKIDDARNAYLSNKFDFNFVCNLLHSQPKKFGKFSFEVAEMEMDTNTYFEGKRLIDLAIEHEELLVLRFLQLFRPDITAFNDNKERILEIATENGNLELFKAILEIPVEAENFEAYLSSEKRHALNLMSEKDLSLLMLAARSGRTDVIRFLLKCGLLVNRQNKDKDTASDFAWSKGHIDTVLELVKNDSPFPYDFDVEEVPDSELEKISGERYNLHEQIKNNQIEEVGSFVERHPNIKCAYDNRNQCALVTALESKKFEIYTFLISEGYTHGIDEDHKKILAALTDHDKEKLALSNRKYFPTNENSHIDNLISRTRSGIGKENVCNQKERERIRKYFETLDAIREVQLILKIVSASETLDVVIDFNNDTIFGMDPTLNLGDKTISGRTIFYKGIIMIAAKGSEKTRNSKPGNADSEENKLRTHASDDGMKCCNAKVLATMAHEFTHYAMHLLYGNEGHPYQAADDESRKQEFEEIVNFCRENQSRNSVIENVFTYEPDEFAVELIVRVPHLLALNFDDSTETAVVRKDFEKLFAFFIDQVLPDCNIPVMRSRQRIRSLNKVLGVREEAEATKLFCDNSNINISGIVRKSKNILIRSSTPDLVLCNLLKSFNNKGTRNVDSLHIFIKLEQLTDDKFGKMISEAFDSPLKPKLFVLATKNAIEFAEIKKFYNYRNMRSRVVSIVKSISMETADENNFEFVFPIEYQMEYSWSDLNMDSQTKVLSTSLQFQGEEISLSDVITANSKILNELPLEEVFKLSEIMLKTFNESVPPSPEIYIERKFKDTSNQTTVPLTSENIIEFLVTERSLILADDSGMGKTTSALNSTRELKKLHPHSLVVYIDLKKYAESYYKDDEVPPTVIMSDFVSGKILDLKGSVETKIFEHFYEKEKVIFIIDGFDEICPVYKNCILEVVKAIRTSNNMLLITTRSHLTTVLEENMHSRIIKLQQFTFDDQVEFLVKFWSQNNETQEQELKAKAKSLLESFREAVTQEDFFGVPLQVRMLAEIYEKSDPSQEEIKELNIFSLYQAFIRKKTEIWNEKGQQAKEYSVTLQTSRSWNMTQIHEKLAIENFFDKKITVALELEDNEESLTDELMVSFGLLRVECGKFLFEHQSFSEYFVADFVLSNVAKKTWRARTEELHKMFLEILRDEKFRQVRLFMNGKLEMKEKLNVDSLSLKLEKSLGLELNRTFFLNLVKENLSALINFMLRTVNISKTCKLSLVNQKSSRSEAALHCAISFSTLSCFQALWSCIKSFTKKDERAGLLFSNGFWKGSVLICAILRGNNEKLKEILKIASHCMDSDSFKKFIMSDDFFKTNALIIAADDDPIAFDLVWKAAEAKLEAKDQKEFLFSQDFHLNNVLLRAVIEGSHEVIQSIWKITKKLFNYEEMKEFLFTEDWDGSTALHNAVNIGDVEVFRILWNFIKDVLKRDDQKILWLKKSNGNSNIFIKSRQCEPLQDNIAKEIISASKKILDPDDLRSALTEKNYRNETFISLVGDMNAFDQIFENQDFDWVAREYEAHKKLFAGNTEVNQIVQDLRDALTDDICAQELKHALYAVTEYGDKALLFALGYGSRFLRERIFQLADMKFNTNERKELIQMISPPNISILREYLMMKNVGPAESYCNFLLRQSDLVPEVKALFLKPDNSGFFFLFCMAFLNPGCFIGVIDWLKINYSREDLRIFFFEDDTPPGMQARFFAKNCNAGFVMKFFDFCVFSLDLTEVKEMILFRPNDEINMLEMSLYNESSTVVIVVWNFYVQTLNGVEMEELLFKNKQGRVYFIAKEKKNFQAVKNLKAMVIERYGEDKTRELFPES